jgi:hypothetical protein
MAACSLPPLRTRHSCPIDQPIATCSRPAGGVMPHDPL